MKRYLVKLQAVFKSSMFTRVHVLVFIMSFWFARFVFISFLFFFNRVPFCTARLFHQTTASPSAHDAEFKSAQDRVLQLKEAPDNQTKLKLYAFFKQVRMLFPFFLWYIWLWFKKKSAYFLSMGRILVTWGWPLNCHNINIQTRLLWHTCELPE